MIWFKKKEPTRYFHVVFSCYFGNGRKFITGTMSMTGSGFIQEHVLNSWREIVSNYHGCENTVILNFIEIGVCR